MDRPERKASLRLQGHDYARGGAYFVTICTQERQCVFGEVVNGEMRLSPSGIIVGETMGFVPSRFPGVKVDSSVVMPNHLHMVLFLGANPSQPTKRIPLGEVIRLFKGACTSSIRRTNDDYFRWQRGYYEHIVSNAMELERVRSYIAQNPARWSDDEENPLNKERLRAH